MTEITSAVPQPKVLSNLGGAFIAINASNQAIRLQADITIPETDEHLKGFNESVHTAQEHARFWSDTISANVQNQLQLIQDHANLMDAFAPGLAEAINKIGRATDENPPTQADFNNVTDLLNAIQISVQSQLYGAGGSTAMPTDNSALGVYNQINQYQTDVGNDKMAFDTYVKTAITDVGGIDDQVKHMNAEISNARTAISKDELQIAGGSAAAVTGAGLVACGVALAPETFGLGLILAGVGALCIIGGATADGFAIADYVEQQEKIAEDLKRIAEDDLLKGIITALEHTSGKLSDHTKTIFNSLDTLKATWQQLDNDISATVTALSNPQNYLKIFLNSHPLSTTQGHSYSTLANILNTMFIVPNKDWQDANALAATILANIRDAKTYTLPQGMVPTPKNIAEYAIRQQN